MSNGFELHKGHAQPAPFAALLLVLVGFTLLYLLTFPQNFTEGEDAVWYVERVARGAPQWHPNHLLIEPLGRLVFVALNGLGFGVSTLVTMQVLSLIAGLVTLMLIWCLTARVTGGLLAPLGATLAVGFSFGFWLYIMMPDTYGLPLPFIVGGLCAVHRLNVRLEQARTPPPGASLWAAFLVALATLFHQQNLFLAVAANLTLFLYALRLPAGRKAAGIRQAFVFGLAYSAFVLGAYFFVSFALLDHRSPVETVLWARGLAQYGLWVPFTIASPVKSVLGLGTTIWSTTFLFGNESFLALAERVFPGRLFDEEVFLAQNGLQLGFWPLVALTGASVAGLLGLIGRAVIGMLRGGDGQGLSLLLFVHVVISFVAITFWEPTNKEFWIAVLPSLFVLLFINAGRARVLIGLFLAPLFVANLFGAMVGFARQDSDYWYMQNQWVIENAAKGDLIVDSCGYICIGYQQLFSPAAVYDWRDFKDPLILPETGRVFVTSRALAEGADLAGVLQERDTRLGLTIYELTR